MADIDVSELMEDPDFVDEVGLITRGSTVNTKGRNVLTDAAELPVLMVVQRPEASTLIKFPDLAMIADIIQVWYKGELNTLAVNGYSDVVVWNGKRYTVDKIDFDAMNWGEGYTSALCVREKVTNNA